MTKMSHVEYWKKKTSELYLIEKDINYLFDEITMTFELDDSNGQMTWEMGTLALGGIIPDIIPLLYSSEQRVVLYTYGAFTPEGLLSMLPYICRSEFTGAYRLSEGIKPEGYGHIDSCISYDFHYECLKEMLVDQFQSNCLHAGIIIPNELRDEALINNYFNGIPTSLNRIVEIADIIFEADRDFEYFHIYSKKQTSEEIIDMIKSKLGTKYRFVEIEK